MFLCYSDCLRPHVAPSPASTTSHWLPISACHLPTLTFLPFIACFNAFSCGFRFCCSFLRFWTRCVVWYAFPFRRRTSLCPLMTLRRVCRISAVHQRLFERAIPARDAPIHWVTFRSRDICGAFSFRFPRARSSPLPIHCCSLPLIRCEFDRGCLLPDALCRALAHRVALPTYKAHNSGRRGLLSTIFRAFLVSTCGALYRAWRAPRSFALYRAHSFPV